MFIMWLGEKITDKGIGNGISLDNYDWNYSPFAFCNYQVNLASRMEVQVAVWLFSLLNWLYWFL